MRIFLIKETVQTEKRQLKESFVNPGVVVKSRTFRQRHSSGPKAHPKLKGRKVSQE